MLEFPKKPLVAAVSLLVVINVVSFPDVPPAYAAFRSSPTIGDVDDSPKSPPLLVSSLVV